MARETSDPRSPFDVFKPEKAVNKKNKKKPSYKQLDIFDEGNTKFY